MEEYNRITPIVAAILIPWRRLSEPIRKCTARGQVSAEAQRIQTHSSQSDTENADDGIKNQWEVHEGDDRIKGVTDADRVGVGTLKRPR